ncbi:MAG: glutamine amidotransferase [Marinobacter sp.]|uniref:glutamine amidotransferase-related protein n=1 Tax=Marinobacter sp. TaxID=50741 RepID=UPI00396E15B8
MKVGILATGITPEELINEFGSYSEMFIQLFKNSGYKFEYEVYDVRDDFFPASEKVADAWIITGSKFNVYQNLPWMQKLKSLILDIHESKKSMIGICFGHQIIAEAFGGKVDKYQGGWGVGLHSYDLVGEFDFINDGSKGFTINAMHQDQVIDKPDNAVIFAKSDFCEYAGLVYDDRILTFQAHPEFTVDYENALVEARKGSVVPTETAEEGLATLRVSGAQAESAKVAHWMAEFIQKRV